MSNELTPNEEIAMGVDLNSLQTDEIVSAATLIKAERKQKKKKGEVQKSTPSEAIDEPEADPTSMADPRWADFVIRQFTESELDPKGRPLVHGLRRVARKLLGPIISSKPKSVQTPTMIPNSLLMTPATVEYEVIFLWSVEDDLVDGKSYQVTYGGVADVHAFNCDPDFVRHASSMAETRAEGRCLRKALGLGKIIAAEEATQVPIEKSLDGKIIKEQLDWLHMIGSRTGVDIMKVLNTKNRDGIVYKSIHDLSYEKACGFTEYMSEISNDRSRILPEWKGFKADWRN